MMTLPAAFDDASQPLVLLAGAEPASAAHLLREAGCHVRVAASAAALMRMASSDPAPQLILLAETVADEPGLAVLSRLQDHADTRAIPVLFVTGGDEELALALGAADSLSLPLRPLVMLARVQVQLHLQRLRLRMRAGELVA